MVGYVTHYCAECGHGLCTDCLRRVHNAEGSLFRYHRPYTTRMSCSFENCVNHAAFKCTGCDVTKPDGVAYCSEHAAVVHSGSHFRFHISDQQCVVMTVKEQFRPEIQEHDSEDDDDDHPLNDPNACSAIGEFVLNQQQRQKQSQLSPHEPAENFVRERTRHHPIQKLHEDMIPDNLSNHSTVDTTSDSSSDEEAAPIARRVVLNDARKFPKAASKGIRVSKAARAAARAVANAVAPLKPRVQKAVAKPCIDATKNGKAATVSFSYN